MASKTTSPRRLADALLETADDMRKAGLIGPETYEKITMRHREAGPAQSASPLEPRAIRQLREQARMSQAVFARHLNVTPGYISQLERGIKKPAGAALALLNAIQRRGIDVVL